MDKSEQLSIVQMETGMSGRNVSISGNKSVVRCLSSYQDTLILADRRGQVRQYSLSDLMKLSHVAPEFEHNFHEKEVLSLDLHYDGEVMHVVSSGRDRNIVLYNTDDLAKSKTIIKLAHSGTINSTNLVYFVCL